MEPLRGGRYVIRGTLGEGAQGTTFDAWDSQEKRAVAIKRFDVRGAKSWKDVELAEREARVLQTLDHPLVPKYIDHFEENDALFLVMEKIDGETVESLRKDKPLPEEEVRRFLACADRAMSYLHGRSSPVVHRDVKPRNVIRRSDGSYVFVDFGAVSELLMRRGSSTIVGTLGYMAPEQLQGRAQASTDVYAVGATALAMLTGEDPDSLPHRGLRVDVRAALKGRASEGMIATLERMLEPDPDRRPATLAAALDGSPSAPSAPPPPVKLGRTREDAAVKSIRNLLWVLWGLMWIIVPVTLKQIGGNHGLVPLIMFGSLACVFIVTWHKGAVIRAIMRYLLGKTVVTTTGAAEQPSIHHRIDPHAAQKVRVHATELRPEEIEGDTELSEPKRARRR